MERMTKERLDEFTSMFSGLEVVARQPIIYELIAEIRACWAERDNLLKGTDVATVEAVARRLGILPQREQETTTLDDEAIRIMQDCIQRAIRQKQLGDCSKDIAAGLGYLIDRLRAAKTQPALKWQKEKPTEPCWCVATNGLFARTVYAPKDFDFLTKCDYDLYLPIPAPDEVVTAETIHREQEAVRITYLRERIGGKEAAQKPAEAGLTVTQERLLSGHYTLWGGTQNQWEGITLSELQQCLDEQKRRKESV